MKCTVISIPDSCLRLLGCRVYKLQRGEVGICAVKPVLVGEKRIDDGTKVLLENNETFTLCEEDMSHVSKYQIRIFKDSRSLRGN